MTPQQMKVSNNECTSLKNGKLEWSKFRIIKNLLAASFSKLFHNSAFNGIVMLQSTMNHDKGVGVISLATMYIVTFLTSAFLPKLVIRRFGCKTTLVLAMLGFFPYITYNFFPHWSTSVPASAVAGIANTLLWPAQSTCINRLSSIYWKEKKDVSKNSVFFGIFSSIYLTSGIWGSLMSYYILKDSKDAPASVGNTSAHCGFNYHEVQNNQTNATSLPELGIELRYMLTGTFVILGLVAVFLILILLDSLEFNDTPPSNHAKDLKATLKVMVKTDQLLLLPLILYAGLSNGFYVGDITKAYVACSWGIQTVSLVAVCSAATGSLVMIFSGLLVKYTGGSALLALAAVLHIGLFVVWLTWNPHDDTYYMLFVMAALYGVISNIIRMQLKALYGVIFKEEEEAAFANYCMWNNVGHAIAFALSNYLNIAIKLYILLAIFCVSAVGYIIVEYRIRFLNKPCTDKE